MNLRLDSIPNPNDARVLANWLPKILEKLGLTHKSITISKDYSMLDVTEICYNPDSPFVRIPATREQRIASLKRIILLAREQQIDPWNKLSSLGVKREDYDEAVFELETT